MSRVLNSASAAAFRSEMEFGRMFDPYLHKVRRGKQVFSSSLFPSPPRLSVSLFVRLSFR